MVQNITHPWTFPFSCLRSVQLSSRQIRQHPAHASNIYTSVLCSDPRGPFDDGNGQLHRRSHGPFHYWNYWGWGACTALTWRLPGWCWPSSMRPCTLSTFPGLLLIEVKNQSVPGLLYNKLSTSTWRPWKDHYCSKTMCISLNNIKKR